MERYKAYKDSGIDWIGEIPATWKTSRLKVVLQDRKEKNDPVKTEEILSLTNTRGVIPYSEKGDIGNRAKEDLTGYMLAYPGDIIVNSMNIIIGSVGLSHYFGAVSPVYYMLRPRDHAYSVEYYNYIFQMKEFQDSLKGYGNGILEIRMRIPMSNLNTVPLPVPPPFEQKTIAAYLDIRSSEIDELIANQERCIELLKEYRKAVISEAVTKGLDPSAPMKGSGTDWIKSIPKEWEVISLKSVMTYGKGLAITKADLTENGIPVVSYGQIHSKTNRFTDIDDSLIRYVSPKSASCNPSAQVSQGDFLFADTSEDLGGAGNFVFVKQNIQPVFAGYHVLIAHQSCYEYGRYLSYLFQCDEWRFQIRSNINGVKLFSITQRVLSKVSVLHLPSEQAKQISDYLDAKTTVIDSLIIDKQRLIDRLIEYRQSLISEAVTGKFKVPGVA